MANFPEGISTRSAVGRVLSSYWRLGQPEEVFAYLTSLLDDSKYQHLRPYLLSRLKFYYLQKDDYETALELCDEILSIPTADEQRKAAALYDKGLIYLNYLSDAAQTADIFWQIVAEYTDNPTAQSAFNQLQAMGEYLPGEAPNEPAEELALSGYPNPFNPTATIRFGLPDPGMITLVVYDLLGREMVRLIEGYRDAGWQSVVWNGWDVRSREVPTGIYIARLITPQKVKAIKLVMMK
ncbi:T9SS type A sorting domain-containing protein [Candidatus Neomarinimicrobiota bacterium]